MVKVGLSSHRRGGRPSTWGSSVRITPNTMFGIAFLLAGIYALVVFLSFPKLISTNNNLIDNVLDTNVRINSNHLTNLPVDQKEFQIQVGKEKTAAFAVSVTGCGSDPITEGAAVLKHSIHRASIRGTLGGKYDYEMFAIYHPSAEACTLPLKELGYILMKRDVFVKVEDIKGEYLRSRISTNGCCGEKELIKLEAYTLTDYPIVVHLDLDVLILKPMDEIFHWMMDPPAIKPSSNSIMWPDLPWPSTINAFFTMDYNMVRPESKYKPVQGGFLVIRPSMKVYKEFQSIVLEGDFRAMGGWGGQVGPFYGSMTFQGLIPYYYNYLHPGQSVELSRCIYNQMADNPRTGKTVNDVVQGKCRVGTEECEDCRSRPLEDVVTTHFTLCQKPWWCLSHGLDQIQHRLCRKLTKEWYKIRSEMEASWGRSGIGPGSYEKDIFHGHCKQSGKSGYLHIEKPYNSQ